MECVVVGARMGTVSSRQQSRNPLVQCPQIFISRPHNHWCMLEAHAQTTLEQWKSCRVKGLIHCPSYLTGSTRIISSTDDFEILTDVLLIIAHIF